MNSPDLPPADRPPNQGPAPQWREPSRSGRRRASRDLLLSAPLGLPLAIACMWKGLDSGDDFWTVIGGIAIGLATISIVLGIKRRHA